MEKYKDLIIRLGVMPSLICYNIYQIIQKYKMGINLNLWGQTL